MHIYQWIFNFLVGIVGGVIGSSIQLYFLNKDNRLKFKKRIINVFHSCTRHSEHIHGSLGVMFHHCKVCNKTWED